MTGLIWLKNLNSLQKIPYFGRFLLFLLFRTYVKIDSMNGTTNTTSAPLDTEKAALFLSFSPYSSSFFVWSNHEYSQDEAYYRGFTLSYTFWLDAKRDNGISYLAMCVDN